MKVADYKRAIDSYFNSCEEYKEQSNSFTHFGAFRMLIRTITHDHGLSTDDCDEIIRHFDLMEEEYTN